MGEVNVQPVFVRPAKERVWALYVSGRWVWVCSEDNCLNQNRAFWGTGCHRRRGWRWWWSWNDDDVLSIRHAGPKWRVGERVWWNPTTWSRLSVEEAVRAAQVWLAERDVRAQRERDDFAAIEERLRVESAIDSVVGERVP